MKRPNKFWLALTCVVAMLSVGGCSDDDLLDLPVEEAVEAGIDEALATTVVPLAEFLGAISDLVAAPPVAAATAGGLVCPVTTGWCTAGSVVCTPGATSLGFDFDECLLATGDIPVTVDGNVSAIPGSSIFLTLTNLFINNEGPMSGTATINVSSCDYIVNVSTDDATVSGTVTQCDSDEYPTGDTLFISFSDFVVTVTFDGSSIAQASATRDTSPVAACTINLAADPLSSSCDAF